MTFKSDPCKRWSYISNFLNLLYTESGRMTYPFSTDHQDRCSSRKRWSHVSLSSISFAISVVSMAWSTEHRAFVVETCFKCGDSVIAAQHQFHTHFGVGRHGRVPNRKTILLWIRNFWQTSSALKRKSPGRPRSVQTPETITTVRHAVTTSPQRSAAKHALALGVSHRSVRRITHLDLKFHPYKIMMVQELQERDWHERQAACERMLANVPPGRLFCSDEAHFHLSGFVNMKNFRYWAEPNPRQHHERPLHSQWVTVWCAVADFGNKELHVATTAVHRSGR